MLKSSLARPLNRIPAQSPGAGSAFDEVNRILLSAVPWAIKPPVWLDPTVKPADGLNRTSVPGSMVKVVTPSAPSVPWTVIIPVTIYGLPVTVQIVSVLMVPLTLVAA